MEFSNPQEILSNLAIGTGSVVVDLGAGTGYYSLAACRLVGSEGRVYAVDVQKDLLERLQQTAAAEGHHGLDIVWGDIEKYGGTKLREATADVVLMCNILFQLEDKRTAINEALRILRPGGRLIAVDWTGSHFGMGPDANLVVTQDDAQKLFEDQHLTFEGEFHAGAQHWGIIMRKQ